MLLLLFMASTLVAQETTLCPPGQYYSADFNTPPIYVGLGPNPSELPPFTPPIDELRGIFWVHGFGGDNNSLNAVATATDLGAAGYLARRTVSVPTTYLVNDLPGAGHSLNQNISGQTQVLLDNGIIDPSYNFIIAHSQGGIVSRMADMQLDNNPGTLRRFYGIATFGSPHNGAQILNSRNSGLVNEFATDACKAVLSTSAASLFEAKPIIALFLDLNGLTVRIEDLCETVPGTFLPFALSKFFSGVSNGYAVGAEDLGDINSHNSAVHKASFHGVEFAKPSEDPTDNGFTSKQVLWRTLGSPPDAVTNAPVFSANEDQDLVDWANTLMAEYQATYELHAGNVENAGGYCDWWEWLISPIFCAELEVSIPLDIELRNIYHNAWRWSQGVDRQWKIIIGAHTVEPVPKYRCTCEFESIPGEPGIIEETFVDNPADCKDYWVGNQHFECTASTEIEFVIETVIRESDGVVTAESAQGYPGAGESMLLNNANHFQLRNSTQTKNGLLKLFDEGGEAAESFFITKTK